MTVLEVQKILASLGYQPGPLDGVWGRRTAAAVRAFQTAQGLTADGIVGPQTRAALRARANITISDSERAILPWYAEASRLYGTRELPGAPSNPAILDWAADLDIGYPNDDIPWCGLFVAHCIGSTLQQEILPSTPLGARSWQNFGIPVTPSRGAVLVFWRGKRSGWQGHVGFYAGEDANSFCVLGGNQSNMVSLAWIAKDRLLSSRWPATVAPPVEPEVVHLARGNETDSIDEA